MLGLGLGMGVGNGSGLKFVGSGPLASAPEASAGNQNMWYMSTDFGLCRYVSVFNNVGLDWIDCGFPPLLSGLTGIADSFTLEAVFSITTARNSRILSFGESAGASQWRLMTSLAGALVPTIGSTSSARGSYVVNEWVKYEIKATAGSNLATAYKNGIQQGSQFAITDETSLTSLIIGGFSGNPSAENLEGMVACFRVRDGSGTVIDTLDLNKWDGTAIARFDSGHACTVSDGTPFTAKSYACIPMSVLQCP